MKKMNNKGFSLVELIVVIAIMAVLVGVLAPQFIKYVVSSRRSTDVQNAETIRSAVLADIALVCYIVYKIKKSRLAHSTQNKALLMAFLSSVIRIWNFQNRNNRFTPCIKRIFPTFFALKCKNQVLCASRDSFCNFPERI